MPENEEKLSQDERLFLTLVINFQTSAWISMGKIKNPLTDKITRNLEEAKFAIDMVGMLLNKTKGNLGDNEQRLLQKALTELRMNYIDEVQKDNEAAKDKETTESKESGTSDPESPPAPEKSAAPPETA